MRFMKRKLAAVLAVLLMLPVQPVLADNLLPQGGAVESFTAESGAKETMEGEETAVKATEAETQKGDPAAEGKVQESSSEAQEDGKDEIRQEDEASSEKPELETKEEGKEADEAETEDESEPEKESETKDDSKKNPEESEKETEEGKESEAEAESTETREKETLVSQLVSAVQNQVQKVAEAAKKGMLNDVKKATPMNAVKKTEDLVKFNTGTHVWSVGREEDFDNGDADAAFEEDGSFTIQIPEDNPFFPYEVQFTYKEKTVNKWFMTPDDSVEVGGHRFYVSAYFDGTVVTQMNFNVAGDTVVVYPEEKEFTDDESGIAPASLLPLEEKRDLTVNLEGRSPLELTQVLFEDVFAGLDALQKGQKVAWKYEPYDKSENYTVSSIGEAIDLSRYTYEGGGRWEMIVGDGDQLTSSNIRYIIYIQVTESKKWLIPTVYTQDETGKRTKIPVLDLSAQGYLDGYYDYNPDKREFDIHVSSKLLKESKEAYIGLQVDPTFLGDQPYDHLKVYEGAYEDWKAAQAGGKDITAQVFASDMTKTDAGYLLKLSSGQWITIVAYDASGKGVTCLPFTLYLSRTGNSMSYRGLYETTDNGRRNVSSSGKSDYSSDGCYNRTFFVNQGYAVDKEYCFYMEYSKEGVDSPSSVTAAYVGKYGSIGEAAKAGATDIKTVLFDSSNAGGYKADYSKGIYFTVFVGADGSQDQEIYRCNIKAEEGEPKQPELSGNTLVRFNGLRDAAGNYVPCYTGATEEDSYADHSYITLLVNKDVDLTKLAPEFWVQEGLKLYADDGKEQKSGESFHDFSKGPVQYTASAENKENGRNYWLQIIKPTDGKGTLYINSLKDPDANTKTSGGVTTSVREMVIDGRSDYQHDILLINRGTEAIDGLRAELQSDTVELDSYWQLTGSNSLAGFSTIEKDWQNVQYGKLPNMAKLRIRPKEGIEGEKVISGTLTIKSGSKTLIVLTLTGTIGDPSITTTEIPGGVKYVPYGVMIQNSNKYVWNKVSYRIAKGKLPAGMSLEENGELYGVPTEAGEFTFTVRMRNSYSNFKDSEREFTLKILENTDANVDGATDTGYQLSQRIPDIGLNSNGDYLLVSQGEYATFKYIFLDGVQLKEGVDYTSEAGSTRITIRSQTLKASNKTGVHTLGIEFRTGKGTSEGSKDVSDLKRAAQNYRVTTSSSSNGTGSGSSGGISSGGGGSNSGGGSTSQTRKDSKKGYVHTNTGIITGSQAGYSRWQQDETGWKLIYADGTTASGYMVPLENGENVEQIAWEKVNGSWYAFGVNGYLKSGWVFDYQLGRWYMLSVDTGMVGGWYKDPVDNHTYYMDPTEGGLSVGWRSIDQKWYYFNTVVTAPSWELNKETNKWQYNAKSKSKPYGSLLRNEKTPDGYEVNADGVWIEK